MRYLVTARVKPGALSALDRAIEEGTLGRARSPATSICTTWRRLVNWRMAA